MNRKQLLSAAVLALVAGVSAAPQVNILARTDYRYDMREGVHEGLKDNSGFDLQTARLDLQGSVDPSLKYRLRLRFDQATAKDTLKGSADYVDLAYVKHALPGGASLTVGKFFSGRAGYEGASAALDLYQTTLVYGGTGAFHSVLGAQAGWEGAGQTVSVTVANTGVGWKGTQSGVQRALLYGATWQGNFLGGKLQPHGSFFARPVRSVGDGQYLGTVGVKSKVDKITAELEWKGLEDTSATIGKTVGKTPFTHSTSLVVKADLGLFRPQAKVFYDNKSVLDYKKSLERVGITPVLEIAPVEKSSFRYHVGYSYLREIPKGKHDYNWNKVFAGVSMNLDILK